MVVDFALGLVGVAVHKMVVLLLLESFVGSRVLCLHRLVLRQWPDFCGGSGADCSLSCLLMVFGDVGGGCGRLRAGPSFVSV